MNLSPKPILGLDISDRSIEILGLQKSFWGKPKITAYNRLELEPGIVADGKILEPELLVEYLKQLRQTCWPGPAKAKLCLLSFPESQVFSHLFRLPASITKLSIRKVVLQEVEKLNVVSLSDVYFDWQICRRDEEELDIFFVAATKALVFEYVAVLNQAGLIPVAFDLESASASRALLNEEKNEAVLLVDLGAKTTTAGFFEKCHLFGSLTLPVGGNNLTAALASSGGFSLSHAEAIKREIGFAINEPTVAQILEQELKPIISGLKDFLAYFKNQGFLPVKKIILAGGTALIPNLAGFFELYFDEEIMIRDPLQKIGIKKLAGDNNFILYANVIGLALRGLQPQPQSSGLNLLAKGECF